MAGLSAAMGGLHTGLDGHRQGPNRGRAGHRPRRQHREPVPGGHGRHAPGLHDRGGPRRPAVRGSVRGIRHRSVRCHCATGARLSGGRRGADGAERQHRQCARQRHPAPDRLADQPVAGPALGPVRPPRRTADRPGRHCGGPLDAAAGPDVGGGAWHPAADRGTANRCGSIGSEPAQRVYDDAEPVGGGGRVGSRLRSGAGHDSGSGACRGGHQHAAGTQSRRP